MSKQRSQVKLPLPEVAVAVVPKTWVFGPLHQYCLDMYPDAVALVNPTDIKPGDLVVFTPGFDRFPGMAEVRDAIIASGASSALI